MYFYLIIPIISILLEGTLFSMPFFPVSVSVLFILYRNIWTINTAFFGGLLLDILTVRTFGSTSIFVICWLFLISLYDRKYEINSRLFIFISSLLGASIYLFVFGFDNLNLQPFISASSAIILFSLLKLTSSRINNTKLKNKNKTLFSRL